MSFIPSFFTDFLQSFSFWLFDSAPIDSFGLPLFTPLYGFSRITSPEVTLSVNTVREGNWPFSRKIVTGANVSALTMERGVFWLDSDFWRWIQATIYGNPEQFAGGLGGIPGPSIRRDLMLVHFFPRGPIGASPPGTSKDMDNAKTANNVIGATGLIALGGITASLSDQALNPAAGQQILGSIGAFSLANSLSPGSAVRIPAKAWLLQGCVPSRYKGASDFDASSSAVSLQELDVEYERFEEISLAA